ncbi:hypothetical protein [Nocardiopsis tropica]|uniref:Uncharacterized protein n=1 Tax=Nocardiopsis tropica TaxID=109330 RepID=A0ABU7KTR8_9ACTN|nr:hypothetical protein [Nocardiopsis umidischolae]MEE2052700.1 hypothetical protein [Nocardiopsis umidischolae]
MATINQRTPADGRTRYWVKWRLGGTRSGAPQSEPFDTHADAHTFKLHVEAAGHQWPENCLPGEQRSQRSSELADPVHGA